jgi:hypothetical protein
MDLTIRRTVTRHNNWSAVDEAKMAATDEKGWCNDVCEHAIVCFIVNAAYGASNAD